MSEKNKTEGNSEFHLIVSLEELFESYSKQAKSLLKSIDMSSPGLEKVKEAFSTRNYVSSCQELMNYYQKNRDNSWINYPILSDTQTLSISSEHELNDIFNDIFTFLNVSAKIPRLLKGNLDWSYTGPEQDREFGYFLNRHPFLFTLYTEYRKTNSPIYAEKFNSLIQDWLRNNPKPLFYKSSVQWRTLEAALRILWVWTFCFFGFQDSDKFSPATRILMLSAIPDHIEYCIKYLVKTGNIRVMELNAIATAAVIWPEFSRSKDWLEFAVKNMVQELNEIQVYPDGAQKELSHRYHYVALRNFEHFKTMVERSERELPKKFYRMLELMWNYYSFVIRPNGYGLLNNDSDLDYCRDRIMRASELYNREDWKFIASEKKENENSKDMVGIAPLIPSVIYPWAGHAVLRNNWSNSAQWLFFDFGPYGIGHQHRDKLHLSIFAHGRDLLVDSGRYCYKKDKWREYFTGTAAHNTILIDGKSQNKYKKENFEEIDNKEYTIHRQFDFVRGIFDAGYSGIKEKISHIRTIVYMRDAYWLVVDSIYILKPHNISVLWHYHPDCTIKQENNIVTSVDEDIGNLRIKPIGDYNWDIKLVKGQQEPDIQGWWSRQYNLKEPSTCAVYSVNINNSSHFIWILNSEKGEVPELGTEIIFNFDNIIGVNIKSEKFNHQIYVRQKGTEIIETPEGIEFDANCLITENKTKIIGASNR